MQRENERRGRAILLAARSLLDLVPSYRVAFDAIERGNAALHLAIMHEPYLSYLVEGKKTVESRFTSNRIAPFGYATQGDVILFKGLGCDVRAVGVIEEVLQFHLNATTWPIIKSDHAQAICADDDFFETRKEASFATLMRMQRVDSVDSIRIEKRDRRGWVVLLPRCRQERLF